MHAFVSRRTARRSLAALLLVLVTAAGLAGAGTAPARAAGTEFLDPVHEAIVLQEDILYGQAINASGVNELLYLDLYRPTGANGPLTDRPLLVFAHGGSFKNGSRKGAEIASYMQRMARHGYAVATISYRLRPVGTPGSKPNHELIVEAAAGDSDTLADAQHDMQAAVRFLRANAATYGVDPGRIAIGGSSAGAVLALQAAINEEDPGDSGTPGVSSEVAGAISVSGAADPDHIEAGDPPFLMFHGGADMTVPAPLGQQACAVTTGLGNACEMTFWTTGGHTPWPLWEDTIVAKSASFLCRVMLADKVDCGPAPLPHEVRG